MLMLVKVMKRLVFMVYLMNLMATPICSHHRMVMGPRANTTCPERGSLTVHLCGKLALIYTQGISCANPDASKHTGAHHFDYPAP